MMRRLLPLLLLAGCSTSTVTLLQGEGTNPVGSVVVLDPKTGDDVKPIDTAGTTAKVSGKRATTATVDPAVAEAQYRDLLANLPEPPQRFTLYFPTGSDEITPESIPERDRMLAEVRRRGDGVSVQIEGHTDREGSNAINRKLSLERANAARDMLVKLGLKTEFTRTVGRGALAPVPGHDRAEGVADPINRRVEVVVR
ncbi:MAG: OmpA family protein [Polymorphobacter sp.]